MSSPSEQKQSSPAVESELVVPVEEIALRLGYPAPVPPEAARLITAAILDAQDRVRTALGRALLPAEYTETGLFPAPRGWQLKHSPVRKVVEMVAERDASGALTGRYTVRYVAGIDVREDENAAGVRWWIRQAACASPVLVTAPARQARVAAVAVEGQSVTYDHEDAKGGGRFTEPGLELLTKSPLCLAGRRVWQAPLPISPRPVGMQSHGYGGCC